MRKISNANQKDYFALKYGREPGTGLTSFGEHKKTTEMGNKSQIFATREDLRQEVGGVNLKIDDLRQEVGKVDLKVEDLRQDVGRVDLKISETKADLIKVIGNLNVDVNKQIANLRIDLNIQIATISIDLNKQIANLSVDLNKQIANLVKWGVGFGITLILMMISIYLGK